VKVRVAAVIEALDVTNRTEAALALAALQQSGESARVSGARRGGLHPPSGLGRSSPELREPARPRGARATQPIARARLLGLAFAARSLPQPLGERHLEELLDVEAVATHE
jgi:hypothetical protein